MLRRWLANRVVRYVWHRGKEWAVLRHNYGLEGRPRDGAVLDVCSLIYGAFGIAAYIPPDITADFLARSMARIGAGTEPPRPPLPPPPVAAEVPTSVRVLLRRPRP